MDERYLLAAVRYIELNPLRAGIVADPTRYRWSSAAAHVAGQNDSLVSAQPLSEFVKDWHVFLAGGLTDEDLERIERHAVSGLPLGSDGFVRALGQRLGRNLAPRKRSVSGTVTELAQSKREDRTR
jgi:putative transposase